MAHDSECERKLVVQALSKKMTLTGNEVAALMADELEPGYICACERYTHLRPLNYSNMRACIGNALAAVQSQRKPLGRAKKGAEAGETVEVEIGEGSRDNVIAVNFLNRRRK